MSDYYSGRSKEEVIRLESPLTAIEPLLEKYGKEYGFELIRNYHDFISRFLHCITEEKINQRIDFYLEDEKCLSFSVWIIAWQDRDDGRYINKKPVVENISPPFREDEIIALLDKARKEVSSWTRDDLKKAYPDKGQKKKK